MNHLNNILLEGVLTRDPEVVAVSPATGGKLVKFTLASDRFYLDKSGKKVQDTLFIPVETYGSCAERVLEKLSKGMTSRVVGRLKMAKWLNRDGDKCSSFEIVAKHVEYRVPKGRNGGSVKEETVILEAEQSEEDEIADREAICQI